jgi:hypothetical protein
MSIYFRKIIEENGYKEKQIYNVNEKGLFLEEVPDRMYMSKEGKKMSRFTAAKLPFCSGVMQKEVTSGNIIFSQSKILVR